jgi:hypothetical protein
VRVALRWLGGIGGAKCGGGWYDWLGTTERTYIEQARQTILGGARESMLFCYGGLQGTDLKRLRPAMLAPFECSFEAPASVALYLFKDGSWVIENFHDEPTEVAWSAKALTVPARGWIWRGNGR